MGHLHDRAISQAEFRLRRAIVGKVVDCDSLVADYDGYLVPKWIALAAAYTHTVVRAYAEEILDPTTADPHTCIKRLEGYSQDVTDYLFDNYFSTHVELWNLRCKDTMAHEEECRIFDQAGCPAAMDKTWFWVFVTDYATGSEANTVLECVAREITKFWRKRLAVKAPTTNTAIPEATRHDRRALKDAYLSAFPETKILDICWAAGQHYSEWKRWLRGPKVLKDYSAPDLAFRRILTSGKNPHDYRNLPRPPKWI